MFRWILQRSDSGTLYLEFPNFWALSIVQYSKKEHVISGANKVPKILCSFSNMMWWTRKRSKYLKVWYFSTTVSCIMFICQKFDFHKTYIILRTVHWHVCVHIMNIPVCECCVLTWPLTLLLGWILHQLFRIYGHSSIHYSI